MVELLPLEACVRPERTETRDGLGSSARASARRCREPCLCLIDRQLNGAFSVARPRRRGGVGSSTELTVELLGRFTALDSLDSRRRPNLGRKPAGSFSFSDAPASDADGLGDEEELGE